MIKLPENAQIIASYTIITDAAGAPAFMLRVDHARTIYQNGLMELRYMLFYVLGMGLLSGFAPEREPSQGSVLLLHHSDHMELPVRFELTA